MRDKKINAWHDTITPRDKTAPWTLGSGGSWDMGKVQPIPDEMLAELAQRYYSAGAPWNCRSMPLSPADREYMFLLYYSMQGLVARMRQAEMELEELRRAQPSADKLDAPWWADAEMLRFAERYRALRKMYVNINPFVHERLSGKLLDFRIDQRLLADSPDGKLPWERASSHKEAAHG